jgi:hypothetical protein
MRLFGLTTLWDAKAHTATRTAAGGGETRNVENCEIQKMVADLRAHPEVGVGFLVALRTGIAKHADRPLYVEFITPQQLLVYVNRLMLQEAPAQYLQDYVMPVLQMMRTWKALQAAGGSGGGSGGGSDDGSGQAPAARALARVSFAAEALVRQLVDAKRRLNDERKRWEAHYRDTRASLDDWEATLQQMLRDAAVGPVAATA